MFSFPEQELEEQELFVTRGNRNLRNRNHLRPEGTGTIYNLREQELSVIRENRNLRNRNLSSGPSSGRTCGRTRRVAVIYHFAGRFNKPTVYFIGHIQVSEAGRHSECQNRFYQASVSSCYQTGLDISYCILLYFIPL